MHGVRGCVDGLEGVGGAVCDKFHGDVGEATRRPPSGGEESEAVVGEVAKFLRHH